MSSTYVRKVVISDVCEIEEGNRVIAVRLNKDYFFVSRKDYQAAIKKHPHRNIVSVVSELKRYSYYTKKELYDIFKNIQCQSFCDLVYDTDKKNSIDAIKNRSFDENRVLSFDQSAHMFYQVDSDIPIPRPVYLNYIDGLKNDDYDLIKAKSILSKNPWVSEISLIDIPYYNADERVDKGLEFKVLLPQDVWGPLIKKLKKSDPEFWSCRIRDHLFYRPWVKTDLLKLRPAYTAAKSKES